MIILSPISLYSEDHSLIIDNFYIKPLRGTEFNIGGSISQEATLAVGGNITKNLEHHWFPLNTNIKVYCLEIGWLNREKNLKEMNHLKIKNYLKKEVIY